MLNDPGRPLVAVGIGNSCVQAGYFAPSASGSVVPQPACRVVVDARTADWEALRAVLPADADGSTPWLLASVFAAAANSLCDWLASQFPSATIHQLTNDDFPISLAVDQPAQVGTDRVAAATAIIHRKAPARPAIFVDAGTAITVNAISREGVFLGGAILPGTTTAAQALFRSTAQLPEISIDATSLPPAVGENTQAAIASGIYWGSIGAVDGLLQRMVAERALDDPELFVTGGFGPALARHLSSHATFDPDLVLAGVAIAGRV